MQLDKMDRNDYQFKGIIMVVTITLTDYDKVLKTHRKA